MGESTVEIRSLASPLREAPANSAAYTCDRQAAASRKTSGRISPGCTCARRTPSPYRVEQVVAAPTTDGVCMLLKRMTDILFNYIPGPSCRSSSVPDPPLIQL